MAGAQGPICHMCGGHSVTGGSGTLGTCMQCGATVRLGNVDIRVEGANADEVSRVTRELVEDASTREQAQSVKSPWVTGTFYLVALAMVVGLLLIAGSVLPVWTLPVIIVGAVLLMAVVGALQLRHDDRLGDESFVKLMGEALRRLPLSWAKSAQPPPPM